MCVCVYVCICVQLYFVTFCATFPELIKLFLSLLRFRGVTNPVHLVHGIAEAISYNSAARTGKWGGRLSRPLFQIFSRGKCCYLFRKLCRLQSLTEDVSMMATKKSNIL